MATPRHSPSRGIDDSLTRRVFFETFKSRLSDSAKTQENPPHCHVPLINRSFFYCTVRKFDIILRSIERMLQTQLSMARKFPPWRLRRYSVKFSKVLNFTFNTPWPRKLNNTGWAWTNILWICSTPLYHCATLSWENEEFFLHLRFFLLNLTDNVIYSGPMNTKWQKMWYVICCLNLLLPECNSFLGHFTLH